MWQALRGPLLGCAFVTAAAIGLSGATRSSLCLAGTAPSAPEDRAEVHAEACGAGGAAGARAAGPSGPGAPPERRRGERGGHCWALWVRGENQSSQVVDTRGSTAVGPWATDAAGAEVPARMLCAEELTRRALLSPDCAEGACACTQLGRTSCSCRAVMGASRARLVLKHAEWLADHGHARGAEVASRRPAVRRRSTARRRSHTELLRGWGTSSQGGAASRRRSRPSSRPSGSQTSPWRRSATRPRRCCSGWLGCRQQDAERRSGSGRVDPEFGPARDGRARRAAPEAPDGHPLLAGRGAVPEALRRRWRCRARADLRREPFVLRRDAILVEEGELGVLGGGVGTLNIQHSAAPDQQECRDRIRWPRAFVVSVLSVASGSDLKVVTPCSFWFCCGQPGGLGLRLFLSGSWRAHVE
ncbi:unnamed protein product [Prorocentrum cordatum]|uniref:Altered inheritance of mitochondria protein 24, mitochondrial n=1 Tax=Prorocentrum cordatum TaxID=2364126 RepID=A0ABN9SZF2_9DINO|nr:unnamed protein product [Polarella glacialis]